MGASLGLGKATYSQAKLPTVRHAPNNRIHAPNRAIDMHTKGIDMHPKLSIDLHPTTVYFAPNRFRIQTTYCQAKLPTVRQSYLLSGKLPTVRHAPKRSRILCTQQPHTGTQPIHRHAPKRHRHAPKRLHILCTQ